MTGVGNLAETADLTSGDSVLVCLGVDLVVPFRDGVGVGLGEDFLGLPRPKVPSDLGVLGLEGVETAAI